VNHERPAATLESIMAAPLARADREALRTLLPRIRRVPSPGGRLLVADGTCVGRVLAFGSVALYRPDPLAPLRHRVLEVDPGGTVVTAIERGARGDLRGGWVSLADGGAVGILPGGGLHPLWGTSDRIVHRPPAGATVTLTLAGAVDWEAVDLIPPVAEPARLPPGSGGALLNLLAALALDQGRSALRYRGPYPTEQLFWNLTESFRCDAPPDCLARFLGEAETTFVQGASREAPVDWTPSPHERRLHGDGLAVHLRDGVEKVTWQGRPYVRAVWEGLRRREHRIVRRVDAGGGCRYVASLEALGTIVEDHLVLDARGEPLEWRDPAPDDAPDRPLAAVWSEALRRLLPLEATPLLATAIDAIWPGLRLVWGGVPGDLVSVRGEAIRLSPKLLRAYRGVHGAAAPGARRAIARRLVREVLGLVGPGVRALATAWLEALPVGRQETVLDQDRVRDRVAMARAALAPLGRLLDALLGGAALPD
jgi:hypothetical protein